MYVGLFIFHIGSDRIGSFTSPMTLVTCSVGKLLSFVQSYKLIRVRKIIFLWALLHGSQLVFFIRKINERKTTTVYTIYKLI